MSSNESDDDQRPVCKYGDKCYRKNPDHLKQFKHKLAEKEESAGNVKQSLRKRKDCGSDSESTPPKRSKTPVEQDENEENSDENNSDEEEKTFPSTPDDDHEFIQQRFLVRMPDDFFAFWTFCKKLNSLCPQDALLNDLGLRLVGPFDVLTKKLRSLESRTPSQYLRHWRYYYDPPEFQTIITLSKKGDESGYHIGYFRDEPNKLPAFVACNTASKGCEITPMGENIFAAINTFIDTMNVDKKKSDAVTKIQTSLKSFAAKNDIALDKVSKKMKEREKKVVTKSFHKAGLVVLITKENTGYRPLHVTDAQLKKLLTRITDAKSEGEKDKLFSEVEHMITCVQFANDECDFGMGLELGIDLFCFGNSYFSSSILQLLPMAYQLLNRPQFANIIKAHLKDRREKPYSLLSS